MKLADLRFKPNGNAPLVFAISRRNLPLARLLVRLGANIHLPDEDGCTPLHAAARTGDVALVSLLVEAGARSGAPNLDEHSAIEVALAVGHEEFIARHTADLLRI